MTADTEYPRAIEVEARGKVNFGLRVAARRGDGFHEIDTVFARLDLADRLRVELVDETGVHGVVHDERDRSTSGERLPDMDSDNLAWRAADAWLRATGASHGVRIELWKHLPVAAGLGGGSSDAGAVLRALGRLAPSGEVDLARLGAVLGSDVPFFVSDAASQRGRGRGERLRPFDLVPRWLVLVNPGTPVFVGDAYGAVMSFGPPIDWGAFAEAWNGGATPRWRNDLQPGVFSLAPSVREAWTALRQAGLEAPLLSGSGGTCFAIAADEDDALRVQRSLASERPDWWVRAARAPL